MLFENLAATNETFEKRLTNYILKLIVLIAYNNRSHKS